MKLFIRFIFLFSLFISFSCDNGKDVNVTNSTEEKEEPALPKNIIFMIGDGMGLTQITAGMIGNNNELNLEEFKHIGLIKTTSTSGLITDSAAGATAFSTGKKTYNGAIGVDADTTSVETILEIAGNGNYATGIIATSSITHATPASFYAHQSSRSMDEAIAMDMLSAPVDFFIGGGKDYFSKREDDLNLLDSLSEKGFRIYDEVDSIAGPYENKIAAFIAAKQPESILKGRKDILPRATNKALDYFSDKGNFFLQIEGSQIDWAGHGNDSEGIIAEMIDFDQAIGDVLEFAKNDGNTLVIITADHETGGYAILGGDDEGNIEGAFSTDYHTGTMVPVFAYGPGAENFIGIYENTAIFDKLLELIER
ncbi:alkaline phosphatase [Salegentibacter sp.]|uniref:alkaline phosphatase n=1 Tax=Salegentibacter sp. TaxID=1903072 RepID=UPI00356148F6